MVLLPGSESLGFGSGEAAWVVQSQDNQRVR
jgi:hypothetical protein